MPGLIAAPEVLTERLRLRGHRRDDADQFAALWADQIVTRFIGGQPMTAEDSWRRMLFLIGHWVANGYGFWAIEERATGAYVGDVGLFEARRGLGADFDEAPEVGWALMPAAHGKGYAREAIAAALAWGEREKGFARSVCMIDADNMASIRTGEAIGFRRFAERPYKGKPILLFERRRQRPTP